MRYVISLSAAFDGTFSSTVFKWACSCCEQLALNTPKLSRAAVARSSPFGAIQELAGGRWKQLSHSFAWKGLTAWASGFAATLPQKLLSGFCLIAAALPSSRQVWTLRAC